MSKREWTPEQSSAINALGGTLIVSAAAGSGKTAVLVERIINRLTDTTNPCDADRLLIVTFTRAATAEMRSRIAEALDAKLALNPFDEHIQRQRMLLPSTQICTIDSFCSSLVRENFELLDITPDFTPLDENEGKVLQKQALATVVEKLYEEDSSEFKDLIELLFSGSDDSSIEDNILKLYTYSRAYPAPEAWLDSALVNYDSSIPFKDSPVVKVICEEAVEYLDGIIKDGDSALFNLENNVDFASATGTQILKLELSICKNMRELIEKCEFDKLLEISGNYAPQKWSMPNGTTKHPDVLCAKAAREKCKSAIATNVSKYFSESEADMREDLDFLRPLANKLVEATKLFNEEYMRLKLEKNSLDFSDITLLTLKLLVEDPAAEKIIPTPLAHDLSERYTEILIDEYQDTNKAQDTIFRAISCNENNMFMVGDIKQSIYGFRQAMPEIFLEKKKNFEPYDISTDNYPACINLGKNFRSRRGVTDYINFVFKQLMSESCGDITYDESEQLVFGASYDETEEPEVEFHALNREKGSEINSLEAESHFVANYIIDKVRTKGENFGDFAILMQTQAGRSSTVEHIFKLYGIPVYTESGGGFLTSADVSTMVSLLRVIDNPLQDIPLLSILMSPIFGFTADEVSMLRIAERRNGRHGTSLYAALLSAEQTGDIKVQNFLHTLRLYRRLAVSLPAGELIRRIYSDTMFPEIVAAMPGGTDRTSNLYLLQTYADNFDETNSFGISAFVRYLDRLIENDIDPKSASPSTQGMNAVRIMSIHKSKGLEFKYCFLIDTAKKFNLQNLHANLILHPTLGIGLRGRDINTGNTYPTMIHDALKCKTRTSIMSETMRVLYVALTRAREHLIIVGTPMYGVENSVSNRMLSLGADVQVDPYTIKRLENLFDWLLTATLKHPSAKVLHDYSSIDRGIITTESKIVVQVHNITDDTYNDFNFTDDEVLSLEPASPELVSTLKSRMEYEYPYLPLSRIATKRVASHMESEGFDDKYFGTARPEFASEKGLTPAQRGSCLHKFMQYADYSAAKLDFDAELSRLKNMEFMTERETSVVEHLKVAQFLSSDIYDRMSKSSNLMREKKFAVLVPAGKFDPELPSPLCDEPVLIQGIADCVFEENGSYIIVDYKTDRTTDEIELVARHKAQLETYAEALSECLPAPVSAAYIYSFSIGKEIKVI